MKKICKICGEEKAMLPWENTCTACQRKEDLAQVQQDIRDGETDADTSSSYYIICPYCGYAMDTCYGYEDFPELYEEGEHEIECPECEKTYIMETNISYNYETRRNDNE